MATHSSVLAWRIPGMGKPGGLPSMGLHRVGHDWSDLAAAAAAQAYSVSPVNSLIERISVVQNGYSLGYAPFFFFPASHFNLTFLAPLILCHGLISSIHNLNSNLCLGVSSWRNLNCDSDYFGRLKLNFQLECLLLLGKQVMRWIRIPTVQTLVSFSHKCSNISDKQVMFTSNFFSKLWHSWGWPFSLGIGYGNSRRDAWASCPVLASSSRLKLWKEPDGFRTEIPNCKLGPSISYLLNFK